jgi:hypothetical protein
MLVASAIKHHNVTLPLMPFGTDRGGSCVPIAARHNPGRSVQGMSKRKFFAGVGEGARPPSGRGCGAGDVCDEQRGYGEPGGSLCKPNHKTRKKSIGASASSNRRFVKVKITLLNLGNTPSSGCNSEPTGIVFRWFGSACRGAEVGRRTELQYRAAPLQRTPMKNQTLTG